MHRAVLCLQCSVELRVISVECPCHRPDAVSSADRGVKLPGCPAVLETLPISTELMPVDISLGPRPSVWDLSPFIIHSLWRTYEGPLFLTAARRSIYTLRDDAHCRAALVAIAFKLEGRKEKER